jgi:hypothetical protein
MESLRMKKVILIGALALGLGACSTTDQTKVFETTETVCIVESVAWQYYLTAIAPSKSESSVKKAEKAHLAVQALCTAAATLDSINKAKAQAEAARSQ